MPLSSSAGVIAVMVLAAIVGFFTFADEALAEDPETGDAKRGYFACVSSL